MAENNHCIGKKLLIFTPYFHPHLGGVEKHVLKTAEWLQRAGWQVKIITRQHQADLPPNEQVQNLPVRRFSFPEIKVLGLLIIWWRVLSRYWQLIRQADVIHVHDVMLWLLPVRVLFPRKQMVLTMHGWEGIYPIPRKNIWLKRLSAVLANKTICVGEYIAKYYGVKCDQVIYGGVDQDSILSEAKLKRKWQLKPGEKLKIVYLGRLAEDTGLKLLLEAWGKLADEVKDRYDLVFVGDGELRVECEKAGKVLGWLDEKQVRSELRLAQLCFASGYLSALEGLAAGCKVVVGAQHQLRQDYWELSELKRQIVVIKNINEICKLLRDSKKITKRTAVDYSWTRDFSWQKLVNKEITPFYQ
jgi:glycosyltransferase involved in cell wall biosynthesis